MSSYEDDEEINVEMVGGATAAVSIFRYIKHIDEKFADVIEDHMLHILIDEFKRNITFLLPDKASRAKLCELGASSNSKLDDHERFSNVLRSLVIYAPLASAADWNAELSDANQKKVPFSKSESSDKVAISAGFTASYNKDPVRIEFFRKPKSPPNWHIWDLHGSIADWKPSTVDASAPRQKGKSGGAWEAPTSLNRIVIAELLIGEYKHRLSMKKEFADENGNLARHNSPLYCAALSLTQLAIKSNDPDHAQDATNAAHILNMTGLDIFLLLEPYAVNAKLLSDALIEKWWQGGQRMSDLYMTKDVFEQSYRDIMAFIRATLPPQEHVIAAIHEIRSKLKSTKSLVTKDAASKIQAEYNNFLTTGTLRCAGVADPLQIMPKSLVTYYRDIPHMKLVHDELRYIGWFLFKRLECCKDPAPEFWQLDNFINLIIGVQNSQSMPKRTQPYLFVNQSLVNMQIDPIERIAEIRCFAYSTMFLYAPVSKDAYSGLSNVTNEPDGSKYLLCLTCCDWDIPFLRGNNASSSEVLSSVISGNTHLALSDKEQDTITRQLNRLSGKAELKPAVDNAAKALKVTV